jgi:VanZ family protein
MKNIFSNRYFWFAIFWTSLTLVLSLIPGKDIPNFNVWEDLTSDKLYHFIFYGILGFSWFKVLGISWNFRLWVIISLFGVLIEFLQVTICTDRLFEIGDMIANSLGGWFGIYFTSMFLKKRK